MSNREFRKITVGQKLMGKLGYPLERTWEELINEEVEFIEYAALIEANRKLEIAIEALETIAKTEKPIYPHSMSSTSRFNMAIASQALEEIK